MKTFAAWYVDMPWQTAALFSLAMFIGICVLILCVDGWLAGREKRAIRRRKRRIFVANRELAKRREDVSVQISRGFMRAMRDQK